MGAAGVIGGGDGGSLNASGGRAGGGSSKPPPPPPASTSSRLGLDEFFGFGNRDPGYRTNATGQPAPSTRKPPTIYQVVQSRCPYGQYWREDIRACWPGTPPAPKPSPSSPPPTRPPAPTAVPLVIPPPEAAADLLTPAPSSGDALVGPGSPFAAPLAVAAAAPPAPSPRGLTGTQLAIAAAALVGLVYFLRRRPGAAAPKV